MFAFQKLRIASTSPPRNRNSRSASHARIHAFSSESPRSHGMSRVRPAARGQVNTRATQKYSSAALTGVRGEGGGRTPCPLLVSSSESRNQIPNLVQLIGRCERDHSEIAVGGIHPESRAVHAQHTGGMDEVDDEIGVRPSWRQLDLRSEERRVGKEC